MKTRLFILFFLLALVTNAQYDEFALIPYPNKITKLDGRYEFKTNLTVKIPSEFSSEFNMMAEIFSEEYFVQLIKTPDGNIVFEVNPRLEDEEYVITVTSRGAKAEVSSAKGCFRAFQTFRQLMVLTPSGSYYMPACQIEDKPAFPWRGAMLDVSRTFRQKSSVKQLLDEMAMLKMNIFHWHLSDDQGWRIEIKKYPELTGTGAWRDTTRILPYPLINWNATVWEDIPPSAYHNKPYGGFYTQEDIKEIVEYAARRHITVIPEIEMPGHSKAAIKAYPWLGSNNGGTRIPENNIPEALNVTDEKVYRFMEDVLKEVMQLFPSKIIHIGGDEVQHKAWENNESINLYMKRNSIKNFTDLQLVFINRISKFIAQKGYRMMGWNEIYGKNVRDDDNPYAMENSNLKPGKEVIVHFWMGKPDLLKEVIDDGYDVVYSPLAYTYTTFKYEKIPLSKAYSTNPVPENIAPGKAGQILGIECPMWGENSIRTIGFYPVVYPRIAAYAEVGWTQHANKDYNRFTNSLWFLKKHWDAKGILYYDEID